MSVDCISNFYNSVLNFTVNKIQDVSLSNLILLNKVTSCFKVVNLYFVSLTIKVDIEAINQSSIYIQYIANRIKDLKIVLNSKYLNFTKGELKFSEEIINQICIEENLDQLRMLIPRGRVVALEDLGIFVLKSAKKNNLEMVRFLLSDGRTIDENYLGAAVRCASKNNYINIIRFLLSEGRTINERCLNKSILYSSKKNHLEIVQFLFSNNRLVQKKDIGNFVVNSCIKSHLEMVKFLLSDGRTIDEEYFNNAVVCAIENNNIEIVKFLLSDGRAMDEEYFNNAVICASENNNIEIVKFLLSDGRTMDEEYFNNAVICASENNNMEMVKFLLSDGRAMDEKYFNDAVIYASENNNIELVKFLFSKFKSISKIKLGYLVSNAAKKGFINIVKFLLTDRVVFEKHYICAIMSALLNSHINVVEFLLSNAVVNQKYFGNSILNLYEKINFSDLEFVVINNFIPSEYLNKIFYHASVNNNIKVVKLLFEYIDSSEEYLYYSFVDASEKRKTDVVEFLLKNIKFSEKVIDEAFWNTYEKGNIEIIELFFKLIEFSEHQINYIFYNSYVDNKIEVFKLLFKYFRDYSEEYFLCLVGDASEKCKIDVVEFLLKNFSFSNKVIYESFWNAYEKDNIGVIELFLKTVELSKQQINDVFYNASIDNKIDVVKILSNYFRDISEEYFFYSIRDSAEKGNFNIVNFLLSEDRKLTLQFRGEIVMLLSLKDNIEILDLILKNGPICESVRNLAINQIKLSDRNLVVIDILINSKIIIDEQSYLKLNLISLEILKKRPEYFLSYFYNKKSLPISFSLKDAPLVIDLGGVTKQVISTLFMSLKEKYSGIYWSSDQFLINESEKDSFDFYTKIANVLSLVFKSNKNRSDKLLIGHVFNKKLFSILKIYMQDLDQFEKIKHIASIMKNSSNPYYKRLFEYILETDNVLKKEKFLEQVKILIEEFDELELDKFLDKQINNILKPLVKFIEGLSEELREKINLFNPDEVLLELQGVAITNQLLKNALVFEDISEELKNLILSKIETADSDWLEFFVKSITGQSSLKSDTKIKITIHYDDAFRIQTCINTLYLPSSSIDLTKFDEIFNALDVVIREPDSYDLD